MSSPRDHAGGSGFRDLLYDKRPGVTRITLPNRPGVPVGPSAFRASSLPRRSTTRRSTIRSASSSWTGAGTAAFCTGGDVREYAERYTRQAADYWKYMGLFQGAVESLLRCGKPTIARLNGITVGGGNELHLACDLSVAASHIYLGQVGVGVGSVACGGATQWLPLVVGDHQAPLHAAAQRAHPGQEGARLGPRNEVAPSVRHGDEFVDDPTPKEVALAQKGQEGYRIDLSPLDASVDALSARLLAMFPECLRYTKQQVNYWKELAWHSTIGHGRDSGSPSTLRTGSRTRA